MSRYFKKTILSLLIISVGCGSVQRAEAGIFDYVKSGFSSVISWFNERPAAQYAVFSAFVLGGLFAWYKCKCNSKAKKPGNPAGKSETKVDKQQQPKESEKPKEEKEKGEERKERYESFEEKGRYESFEEKEEERKERYESFDSWYTACKQLPANITKKNGSDTTLTWSELKQAVDKFIITMQKDSMSDATQWIENNESTRKKLTELYKAQEPIHCPFVQKLNLPADSIVSFHGDMHGDIHSLLAYIKSLQKDGYLDSKDAFKITNKKFYMVFLGDYTDRGNYGSEVLYTIMRLKIANPDQVFLVRGNHEDTNLTMQYGFYNEFERKFKQAIDGTSGLSEKLDPAFNYVSHMYDFLPAALYLGTGNDYIQCCHGGMEMGFDPKLLLKGQENVKFTWLGSKEELSKKAQEYSNVVGLTDHEKAGIESSYCRGGCGGYGFMWNDFIVTVQDNVIGLSMRGLEYPCNRTKQLLAIASEGQAKVHGVFRAHQHSSGDDPMMLSILDKDSGHTGLSKLWKDNKTQNKTVWDGIVCTFCVSPDTVYSNNGQRYNYDTYGILKLDAQFDAWNLEVKRNTIITDGRISAYDNK